MPKGNEANDSGFSCQCGQFSVAYVAETDERTNLSCGCGADTVYDAKDEQVYINEETTTQSHCDVIGMCINTARGRLYPVHQYAYTVRHTRKMARSGVGQLANGGGESGDASLLSGTRVSGDGGNRMGR